MKLLLKRNQMRSNCTIGNLYINGTLFSNTLEDVDRGLLDAMSVSEISSKKIYGETAIPKGTYKIDLNTVSSKFGSRSWALPYGGKVPRLLNVKGFEGVLIHPGNTAKDTLGCILVGKDSKVGTITESVNTFKSLMTELYKAKNLNEDITITIE